MEREEYVVAMLVIRVPVGDDPGCFVEVEVDRALVEGSTSLAGAGAGGITTAAFSLASAMDRILPAVNEVMTKLRSGAQAPDEIQIQLGMKIGGETGLVLAKASGEGTFAVQATWRKPAVT